MNHETDGMERPMSYSSQAPHSQPNKEALTIVFGMQYFYMYLYGSKFTLCIDNKPLTRIFHSKKSLTSARFYNMTLFSLDIIIQWSWNKIMEIQMLIIYHTVLFLTLRLTIFLLIPLGKRLMNFMQNKYSKFQMKESIQNETSKDPILAPVVQELCSSNAESLSTLYEGILFCCDHIVIPKSLQLSILQEIHESHLESTKWKSSHGTASLHFVLHI